MTGESLRVVAREGQSVYEVALKNDVNVGDCYTCHVVLSPESYAAHDKPLDEVLKSTCLLSTSSISIFMAYLYLYPSAPLRLFCPTNARLQPFDKQHTLVTLHTRHNMAHIETTYRETQTYDDILSVSLSVSFSVTFSVSVPFSVPVSVCLGVSV